MLKNKFLTWQELFDIVSNNTETAFNSEIESVFGDMFDMSIPEMMNLGRYIYCNNGGLCFFRRNSDNVYYMYVSTLLSFCENNKERLLFSLQEKNINLDKTRNITENKLANKDNNYEEADNNTDNNTTIGSNDKAGFYNSNSTTYVSSLPKNEVNGTNVSTITGHSKKSKNVDETVTVNETIKDPYSFIHINDFINNYKTFYDIISEYYKEFTVPFR